MLLILCATLSPELLAQDASRSLKRFFVVTTTGERIEGRGGHLTKEKLTGESATGAPISVSTGDIQALYESEGSQTALLAALGAGVGLAAGIAASIETRPGYRVDSKKAVTVTIGLIGAGALIGALVGSSSRKWRRLSLETTIRDH